MIEMTLDQKIEKAIKHAVCMLFNGDKEDIEIGALTILEMFCIKEQYEEIQKDWNDGLLSTDDAIEKHINKLSKPKTESWR